MSDTIRIVIADAHPMMREGLRATLDKVADFKVVAEAGDGYAAVLATASHGADVVVLDSALPRLDGYETIVRLRAQNPDLRILVSLNANETFDVQEFVQAGANGILARNTAASEFTTAIRALSSGGAYFSNALLMSLMNRSQKKGGGQVNMFGLTSRELEILRQIGSGFSNKDIARRLELSVRTVETHRLNIRKKTNATRFKDLLEIARRLTPERAAQPAGREIDGTLTMMM